MLRSNTNSNQVAECALRSRYADGNLQLPWCFNWARGFKNTSEGFMDIDLQELRNPRGKLASPLYLRQQALDRKSVV